MWWKYLVLPLKDHKSNLKWACGRRIIVKYNCDWKDLKIISILPMMLCRKPWTLGFQRSLRNVSFADTNDSNVLGILKRILTFLNVGSTGRVNSRQMGSCPKAAITKTSKMPCVNIAKEAAYVVDRKGLTVKAKVWHCSSFQFSFKT